MMDTSNTVVCSQHRHRKEHRSEEDTRYPYASPLDNITSLFSSSSSASSSSSTKTSINDWIPKDPVVVGIISAAGATCLTLGSIAGYRRYWRRIRNANSVTTGMLDRKTWIRGVVTSVGDGDNLRLYHTPGPFFSYPFKIRSIPSTPKELKDETIHIRIAGVDAPENAHFGQPAQPHAKESLEWLRGTILGKRMRCQLLAKDQYNRIVAVPYINRLLWFDKPLPILMLKEGMAVVYEAGGAEYGPWGIDKMKSIEAQARSSKKGLWSLKKFEHPSDFKARMKRPDEVRVPSTSKAKSRTLLGRVWGWIRG
ncbi:mitochondrial protein [Kwoniella mangroviensis CBS 10435]|uniref:Probable endonuclease LCL3 n=1 Tax=Kwoniella mangroviensis CBS 10435 TaxID=1331196 RepID=A0A1B9IHH2_9TREE|nr:mitochondrial protein [Kwoniella mangroviensis CBS 8507]OCF54871.1 mitochondrial protein [Kwoniella mangroviensis CBS 10435]OCF67650.1 mitochondrial protein [Kwoniella mangroviensis CBS 8507]